MANTDKTNRGKVANWSIAPVSPDLDKTAANIVTAGKQ